MTYTHCLYPLPPQRQLYPRYNEDGSTNKLSIQTVSYKTRLWPETGPNEATKTERRVYLEEQDRIYQEQVKRERAAAKEVCKRMTIQEAWAHLKGHLHANEYDVEMMSEAGWDIYLYAKKLLNQHFTNLI